MAHLLNLTAIGVAFLFSAGPALAQSSPNSGSPEVKITEQDGKLRIDIGNQLFSEYHFKNTPRPYMYPIIGPGGQAMTRNWPMKEAPDEERDHPHHKSLWFTHGELNGIDFWSDGDKKGRIVQDKLVKVESGAGSGTIQTRNNWVAPDGKLVCTDERITKITALPKLRIIDFQVTINASQGDLVFGDTKEGSFGIRLAETMRLKGKVGKGHIINSAGQTEGDTWGKRAEWCDYYGPVDGTIVGVAVFDHPQNPRYPTWWHVRDYGLFAANPFGIHDFEKKPAGTGDFKVASGQSVTFRYRVLFHLGNEKEAGIASLYKEYVK